MQLDRRRLVLAGLGIGGAAAGAGTDAVAEPPRRGPPASVLPRPDTGSDQTIALQGAIDRAARSGEQVVLAPGRYLVRGLKLSSGVRLAGSGGATVLQHLGGPPLLFAEDAAGITIERLTLSGGFPMDRGARGLVEIKGVKELRLEDLVITTSPVSGVVLERCSGTVTRCRITGAAKAGIFSNDSAGGLEISHNHLDKIGNNGILVWRSALGEDGSIVAMNRIERISARDGGTGENGNAINVFRAGGVIVTSNRIADCAFTGVRANSASNVQILSNSITRVGEVAIFAEFAFEGAVISSNLVDGASTGVSVTNFDHGGRLAVVQGNLIRNLKIHTGPSDPGGYGIAVEADAAVNGNTVEGAPTAGLSIGWGRFGRDVAATGNVIRKSVVGIAVTSDTGAGTALIANNLISGSSKGAIRSNDHGRLIGEDLALAPSTSGRIRTSGNVVA